MRKGMDKRTLFAETPVPKALLTMAVPTIISQMISVIYNMVDAFFIGRTGNSYMMAATTVTLTLVMMNVALSNLFGIGGGSFMARLMGMGDNTNARRVSAFSLYGMAAVAILYSLLIGLFTEPILRFLGASDETIGYARSYALIVTVIGGVPAILSMTLSHLLRNAGYSGEASIGLSGGGILNVALDPLFMFVLMPKGQEVTGAAIATALSNTAACVWLLYAYLKAGAGTPLCASLREALRLKRDKIRGLLAVGVPSAVLTGLFDVGNICLNILSAAHSDLVLAGMGITMKLERLPNAVNVGLCQGMMPIVAFNFASGNHRRMRETITTGRRAGLIVSVACIVMYELLAPHMARLFLSVTAGDAASALITVGYATLFLRIRCIASPLQFTNYHTSYCLQALGDGRDTLLHAAIRILVLYVPIMFLMDRIFGETGLAAALPVSEGVADVIALWLLHRFLNSHASTKRAVRS